MAPEATVIASSIVEPSIQELARHQRMTEVPSRYIRPEVAGHSSVSDDVSTDQQIPVIDMHKLLSGDDSELQNLHSACKEWGFFQLVNHGVSTSLVEKMKGETRGFFELPIEEKNKYWQRPGDIEGFGQLFIATEDQKLDWGYGFTMFTRPTHLRKPHIFPELPISFRDTLEVYLGEVKTLTVRVLDQMAKALKMDRNEMKDLFEDGVQSIRMNYYPPCPQPDKVIGFNAHADGSALTFLLQVNETDGLQVKKDGKWVPVKPLSGAFIVNIGDVMEIVSNGVYRSIEHRATVNIEKERISFGTFYNAKLDGIMGPAKSLVTPKNPAIFRDISVVDHFKSFFSSEVVGKSFIDFLRIQNPGQQIN